MSDKSKQTTDAANTGIGVSPVLNQAPPDRRQNGFHGGGTSGESAGDSRGKQGNG